MTNYEKYKDEIIKISKDSANDCLDFVIPNVLEPMTLDCDDITCDTCNRLFSAWLLNEYKEPEKPEVDWSKISVDTKIYVKDNIHNNWIKRYFARYEEGKIYAWDCGHTSWIAGDENCATSWKYAKLAEDENL